jgi:hypothetical protein
MYKWQPSLAAGFSEYDPANPLYGFSYDRNPGSRNISATEIGIAQFQPSLMEHKNETPNIEYNPLDVFNNAVRCLSASAKPRLPKQQRGGRNPDPPQPDMAPAIPQRWNELPHNERHDGANPEQYFGISQGSVDGHGFDPMAHQFPDRDSHGPFTDI